MKALILTLLLVLAPAKAGAALSDLDRASIPAANILPNGGFEGGAAGTVASGGATATVNATARGTGSYGYDWDSNAAGQTLTGKAVTIPPELYGKNGVVSCAIKNTGTNPSSAAATHQLMAYDGTNEIVATTITSSTSTFARTSVNFVFPGSGTITWRIKSVATNEPEIYIDDCVIADAGLFNLSQVNQAQFVGSAVYPNTAGCIWTTTSTVFASFGAVSACPAPTVTGLANAVDADLPQIAFTSLPPGEYMVIASGHGEGVAGTYYGYTISDGTSQSGNYVIRQSNAGTPERAGFTTVGFFSYSTAGARTFRLFGFNNNGSTTTLYNNQLGQNQTEFKVYRFPTTSELAFRPEQVAWYVDANISGANISLGTAAQADYVSPQNGSLTLTQNAGSIATQIGCDSTNPPTGTTCAVGVEQPDISFTVPSAGAVRACVSFSYTNGGSGQNVAFQIVETAINSQTIVQEGKSRIDTATGTSSGSSNIPLTLCGTFYFSSAGQKMLRLKYEQLAQSTVPLILADAAGSLGQRDIHWEVYPISQAIPAPILVGSVTSNSAGAERVERLTFGGNAGATAACTLSPCTISAQSGTWVSSITRNSTGNYTINIPNGIFSAFPSCNCSGLSVGANVWCQSGNGGPGSATAVNILTSNSSGVASDASVSVLCMGPR